VDILYLLDRLEEELTSGRRIPFWERTLIDEQECLEILDQIRVAIPEEIKAARRITEEREQLLTEARAEAERILGEADQQVAGRISEHTVVRGAQSRAAEIEDDALRAADEIRREADEYAYRVLERLRSQIEQITQAVDRGLKDLAREERPV
jgi:cell division septum initiation protein DivIVA